MSETDTTNDDDDDMLDVVIVGGGLVGLATAVGLSRQIPGIKIKVLERAQALRPVGAALGLFPNGLAALGHLLPPGIYQSQILDKSVVTETTYAYKADDGELTQTMDMKKSTTTPPRLLVWYLQQQALVEALPNPDDILRLGIEVLEYSYENENEKEDKDGDETTSRPVAIVKAKRREEDELISLRTRILIGADGIRSTIRDQMLQKQSPSSKSSFDDFRLQYHNKVMLRAVVDCNQLPSSVLQHIPPIGSAAFYKSQHAGRLWSHRITCPSAEDNSHGPLLTITAMTSWPNDPSTAPIYMSTNKSNSSSSIHEWMRNDLFVTYPKSPVLEIMDSMHKKKKPLQQQTQQTQQGDDDKNNNPQWLAHFVYDVAEVLPCWTDEYDDPIGGEEGGSCTMGRGGHVIVIGDAAHAMTPGLGQGANIGFEDACELVTFLKPVLSSSDNNKYKDTADIPKALTAFWKSRKSRVVQVHAASRARTMQVNSSTTSNKIIDAYNQTKQSDSNDRENQSLPPPKQKQPQPQPQQQQQDEFYQELYGWKPSSSSSPLKV